MNDAAPVTEEVFAPRELPLVGDLYSYLAVLAQRAPGKIAFRTGAGRIFRDLLIHWPTLDDWEDEAQELCQRITDAVYPLTGALYAQAIEMAITISPTPILPPTHIDALSTYVLFDVQDKFERHYFLSPEKPLPPADALSVTKGIAILCRPLNYRYHTIKDDRGRTGHPHAGIFELSERLINELYGLADYTPRDGTLVNKVKTDLHQLPKLLAQNEASRDANLSLETHHLTPIAPEIARVTSLSGLPAPVRALERRLMSYVTDKSVSPTLRVGFRRIAQSLRQLYPQTTISEAAHAETAPPALKTRPLGQPPSLQPKPQTTLTPVAASQPLSTPRLVPTPLSIHPSLVLPTTSPVPAFLQQQPVRRTAPVSPTSSRRTVDEPNPTRTAPNRPELNQSDVRPEPTQQPARQEEVKAQPTQTRQASPTSENRPTYTQQSTRPSVSPERRPAVTQRTSSRPAPQATPQQARVSTATPNAKPVATPSPTTRPLQATEKKVLASRPTILEPKAKPAFGQPRMSPSQPTASPPQTPRGRAPQAQPTIRVPQSQQTVRPTAPLARRAETKPDAAPVRTPTRDVMPAPLERFSVSATRHFEDLESRPTSFYDRLKTSAGKPFPKAIPISGVGRLDKIATPKLVQTAQVKAPLIRPPAVFPTPSPMPAPLSPFFWLGK